MLDTEKSSKVMAPELTDQWGRQARKEAITTQPSHDRFAEWGAEREVMAAFSSGLGRGDGDGSWNKENGKRTGQGERR